jgi:ABC-type transport system involved in multi-copper enzyme maturation permease subunit
MNLQHFFVIYQTEVRKLFSRLTSKIGLVLCVLFGLWGPGITKLINWGVITPATNFANENPDAGMTMQPELLGADQAIATAFGFRGFFFLPILLFIMAGLTFAAEHANRSIREYALRPVSRPTLVMTRWLSLCTWVVLAVSITFILSAGMGTVLNGTLQDGWAALQNFGTALCTDLAFVTLALSVAIFSRSIAATIAILVVVFVLQLLTSIGLNMLSSETVQGMVLQMLPPQLSFVENTFWVADYLVIGQPPLLWGACMGTTYWQGYATLAVIAFGSLFLSLLRFQRMDLP